MFIELIKSKEIGMAWTNGHRDQWTQCAMKIGDNLPVLLERHGSVHAPNPTAEDLAKFHPWVTPEIKKIIQENKEAILDFFNSVEEGEKNIPIPFVEPAAV